MDNHTSSFSNFPAIQQRISRGKYPFSAFRPAPAGWTPAHLLHRLHWPAVIWTVWRVNSLFVIAPYKYEGMWVFDDSRVGLVREPFIAGIDTMIDRLVAGIPGAERGFRAVFSAAPFPGHTERLEWRREESGGNWYYNDHFRMEGWLCPALFKYFAAAPKTIYIQVEPRS